MEAPSRRDEDFSNVIRPLIRIGALVVDYWISTEIGRLGEEPTLSTSVLRLEAAVLTYAQEVVGWTQTAGPAIWGADAGIWLVTTRMGGPQFVDDIHGFLSIVLHSTSRLSRPLDQARTNVEDKLERARALEFWHFARLMVEPISVFVEAFVAGAWTASAAGSEPT